MDNQEPYRALDELIDSITDSIPHTDIEAKPDLKKALIRALKVIDHAVREGRYMADVS